MGPEVNVGTADSNIGHFKQDLIIGRFRNWPLFKPVMVTNNMEKLLCWSKKIKLQQFK